MKKFIIILFLFSAGALQAQTYPAYLRTDKTLYVESLDTFVVSLNPVLHKTNSDSVFLFLQFDNSVEPLSAFYKSDSISNIINIVDPLPGMNIPDAVILNCNLADNECIESSVKQFLIEFLNNNKAENTLISAGIILKDENGNFNVINCNPGDNFSSSKTKDINVFFYDAQSFAGNKLKIYHDGRYKISVDKLKLKNHLLNEFWLKPDKTSGKIQSIIDPVSLDTLVELGVNNYGMLYLNTGTGNNIYLENETHITRDIWTHISLIYEKERREIVLYANEVKVLSAGFRSQFPEKISLIFYGNIELDGLNLFDFNNSISTSLLNIHYPYYSADSSKSLLRINFDDDRSLNLLTKSINVKSINTELVPSDAPIFSRAPEIDISIYDNFYIVEWQLKDNNTPEKFILEESYDGSTFHEIYSISAFNETDKKYSYTILKDRQREVVYYRIGQVNSKDEITYSNRIKVGHSEKKNFILHNNYPNPFNPVTVFDVEILQRVEAVVAIYDVVGKRIELLHEGILPQGNHSFKFDASNLPSGIYFYEVKTPSSVEVKKMILAK